MVKKHSTKDLYIIKYLHSGIDWSQPYALDARGIVLDGDSNVISRPYRKFFNYRELESREDLSDEVKKLSQWDNESYYHVYDKLDGSLAVISQYEGELLYSSSGNLEGKYPEKFKNWVENNLNEEQKQKLLDYTKFFTMIFEYVSPTDRIVLGYNKEELILHGVNSTDGAGELDSPILLRKVGEIIGVKTAEEYNLDLSEMLKIQKDGAGGDLIEGFVIKFKSGKRLKIKTQEYLDLHGKSVIGFGKINSKAKVKMYIDMIENDEIDDFIALHQQREDMNTIKFLSDVYIIHQNFMAMVDRAKEVNEEDGFSKRDWAINKGVDGTFDKLVLNISKKESIDRLKEKYMLEMIEERMEYQ